LTTAWIEFSRVRREGTNGPRGSNARTERSFKASSVAKIPEGRQAGLQNAGEIVASNGPNRFRVLFKRDGRQPFFSRGVDLATLDLPFFSNLSIRRGGRLCVRSFLRCGRALIHRLVTLEQNKNKKNLDNDSPREGTPQERGDRGVGQRRSSLSLARARPTEGHLGNTGREGRAGCRIGSLA
jgi:hypothetical protein